MPRRRIVGRMNRLQLCEEPGRPRLGRRGRDWWLPVVVGIGVVAFLARLLPTLRGGGLSGLGVYDDGVYYAAAASLVAGRVPYEQFVLLHPPGIAVALAPYAVLGRMTSDPTGFAVARLAMMLVGAGNAAAQRLRLRGPGPQGAAGGGRAARVRPGAARAGADPGGPRTGRLARVLPPARGGLRAVRAAPPGACWRRSAG